MDSVLDSLMKAKIPQGTAHRKVEALVNAGSVAKVRLQTAGAEQELLAPRLTDWRKECRQDGIYTSQGIQQSAHGMRLPDGSGLKEWQ